MVPCLAIAEFLALKEVDANTDRQRDKNLPLTEHVANNSCFNVSESVVAHGSPLSVTGTTYFKTSFQ